MKTVPAIKGCIARLVRISVILSKAKDRPVLQTRQFSVYILASRTRRLYVGVTSDLNRRVWEHKSGMIPGFTRRYGITRLVYAETTSAARDAIVREKQIKGWLRQKKIALIESKNPEWQDLAATLDAYRRADPSLRSG